MGKPVQDRFSPPAPPGAAPGFPTSNPVEPD
nr:MAG TPA: hypothetical protein [Caudoviricetes sp.]